MIYSVIVELEVEMHTVLVIVDARNEEEAGARAEEVAIDEEFDLQWVDASATDIDIIDDVD